MTEIQNEKRYDLGGRTFRFAERAFQYFNSLPKTPANTEVAKQGIRAAGSIGANYIEANEALSKKDFMMRMKISRKEAKEEIYWLRLSKPGASQEGERAALVQEATELMKIFGSIISKSS
jgi:four helix bundle protein